jgi:hypothetical protein
VAAFVQDSKGHTPPQFAELHGQAAVVCFLMKNANNKRRANSITAPIVDPAAQAADEVAAATMAALLIAEEEEWEAHKRSAPSKQGNSNKTRKQINRRKANLEELDNGSKGHDEATSVSVASSSSRRDDAGERDGTARDAARHSRPDGEMDAYGGEKTAGPPFNNNVPGHHESEGNIGKNIQLVEASSVEREADTSPSGVDQLTATQAERRQQKERERKGKQWQRKRATTQATLKEALAQVDTAGASLDTLNRVGHSNCMRKANPTLSTAAGFALYRRAGGVVFEPIFELQFHL